MITLMFLDLVDSSDHIIAPAFASRVAWSAYFVKQSPMYSKTVDIYCAAQDSSA
jgi:hypothetical protein